MSKIQIYKNYTTIYNDAKIKILFHTLKNCCYSFMVW